MYTHNVHQFMNNVNESPFFNMQISHNCVQFNRSFNASASFHNQTGLFTETTLWLYLSICFLFLSLHAMLLIFRYSMALHWTKPKWIRVKIPFKKKKKKHHLLTESLDIWIFSIGLANWIVFKSVKSSSDQRQTFASWLAETNTSLIWLTCRPITGPRWWSIFVICSRHPISMKSINKVTNIKKWKIQNLFIW